MTLGARLVKAEQSVRMALTVREWETFTDPATVARQMQEAAERIRSVALRRRCLPCCTPYRVLTLPS